MTPEQDLIELNRRVGEAEKQRDEKAKQWFGNLLSDQLMFRRASGKWLIRKH